MAQLRLELANSSSVLSALIGRHPVADAQDAALKLVDG